MYINKIRDIFQPKLLPGTNIEEAFELAKKCGFTLLTWNGMIYIQTESEEWFCSSLTIQDFEV